ncbi:hypothetical protein DITRI_Ditri03aG0139500 [Diplodiscus trichospermus]
MSANLDESVGLPYHFVPKVARESACVSSVPLRRSEPILLMQASKNSVVPDVETKITSMQCAGTQSGTKLKFSTSASLSLDGKNIMARGSNNQKGKRKPGKPRKFRAEPGNDSNKQIKCINPSIIGTDEPSVFPKENSEVVKGPIACPVWRNERAFNALLTHLLDHGLAMKTMVDDIVLLVFTSPHLPYEYWRAGGKYYLWAVFRGKNAFFPQSREPRLCVSKNELLMGSNLSENAGTADDRNSCRNFDKQEEQKGKKRIKCMDLEMRMKSLEMPLLLLKNSDCTLLEKLVDPKASGKDQERVSDTNQLLLFTEARDLKDKTVEL